MQKIAIIIPVYNDWRSFVELIDEIDRRAASIDCVIDIIAIDDGSTAESPMRLPELKHIDDVSIVHLACNLGHQRAIAVGLAHAHRLGIHEIIIVMDGDGEDRPEDLNGLFEQHRIEPSAIIVGQRTERSEGATFRNFYNAYKALFAAMTGQKIDFGNFCLIPRKHLGRIVHMPELWNHLAATVLRSKVPVTRLSTKRGLRYSGQSSMSFISLITHGLGAIAVFSDVLFVRLLVASLGIMIIGALIAIIAIVLRLFTGLAIPGWSTTAVGVGFVVTLQGLTLSTTAAFMTLSNRAILPFIPEVNSLTFVREIENLEKNFG